MKRGTVFLMYHELSLPGRPLCQSEPGYTRYVVPYSEFRSQMERFARENWSGKNVSDAIQSFGGKSVCLTFDDGCETDLICSAPVLKEFGFGATFYITLGFLGKTGYMSEAQVRSLRDSGFEIGCHSLSHPYLTDLDKDRLRDETAGAKDCLEQIVGSPIRHFSCPGGRWNQKVLQSVKDAGFQTMATSQSGVNSARTNPFALRRVAILGGTAVEKVVRISEGGGLLQMQMRESARDLAKNMLGNTAYDSLRSIVLGKK